MIYSPGVLFIIIILSLLSLSSTRISNTAIDISHYQPHPKWDEVIESGIEVVIHKATQDVSFVDWMYEQRKQDARAAGLKYWGAYHFASGADGAKQGRHFLKAAGDADFFAIDLELNPTPGQTTVTTDEAEKLAVYIFNQTGRYPVVYGSWNFLTNYLKSSRILSKCPLWVANWIEYPPNVPKMWNDWVLWQYTDGRRGPKPHGVPGIGNCDRDQVNMTSFCSYLRTDC